MNIKLKLPYKILSTSILCGSLTACGGSGSDVSIDDGIVDGGGVTTPIAPSLGTIDSSNFLSVFQTGVTGSANVLREVMFAGDDIDPDVLTELSSTGVSQTFACHNTGGTIQVDQVESDTQAWTFNNCHITNFAPETRYHGTVTTVTTMNSGSLANIGSYLNDWSATQLLIFNNYTETSPIVGGSSQTTNGKVFLGSSNNLNTQQYMSVLSGSDLFSIDTVDASGTATSYDFSNITYVFSENNADDTVASDLDFIANISGIGDVEVTTRLPLPVLGTLMFDADGKLASGAGVVTTASSTAKMIGTGNDNVEITLDPEKDGSFEAPIFTTWSAIGGS